MRHPSRSQALGLSVGLLALGSSACATETAAPQVVQVEVQPIPKALETRFRGELSISWADHGDVSTHTSFDRGKRELVGEITRCLSTEAPTTLTAWTVGWVDRGKVGGLKSSPTSSPAAVRCVEGILARIDRAAKQPSAFSLTFRGEPAPADCKGNDCVEIPSPDAVVDAAEAASAEQGDPSTTPEHAEFGMIGLLNAGPNETTGDAELRIGGAQTGGRGEGIGLGSIGTLGHGTGLGTGQGFGNGNGRLAGSHRQTPPSLRVGDTAVSPGLPPEVIKRIVRQNFGRFRLCYENALRTKPELAGQVKVSFVIALDGNVGSVVDGGSSLPDPDAVACVLKSFRGLSFPAPEKKTVKVTYPINFAPGEKTAPPILKVGGVGFPALDAGKVAAKLESKGWATMTVEGAPDAPFTVFAIKRSKDKESGLDAAGPVIGITRLPEKAVTVWGSRTLLSEGFQLVGEGDGYGAALDDLSD